MISATLLKPTFEVYCVFFWWYNFDPLLYPYDLSIIPPYSHTAISSCGNFQFKIEIVSLHAQWGPHTWESKHWLFLDKTYTANSKQSLLLARQDRHCKHPSETKAVDGRQEGVMTKILRRFFLCLAAISKRLATLFKNVTRLFLCFSAKLKLFFWIWHFSWP